MQITRIEDLFCFQYQSEIPKQALNMDQEYKRFINDQWRVSRLNEGFEYSPTYPSMIAVPSRISDNVLRHIGVFRSKSRIPALSYLHRNQISITRSSQPMVGLAQNRSIQDEKLVEAIFNSTGNGREPHLIIDARPTANAMAQTAMGAGTESVENYKGSRLVYLGIDNIHVVRDSMSKLYDACTQSDQVARERLERSGWLKHIRNILDGTLLIVQSIDVKQSHVLVHCSDGWDRTAQLSSLAQICLDPYYRTIDGLSVLLTKEWISFGFKFKDRCGHLYKAPKKEGEKSVQSQLKEASSNFSLAARSFLGSKNLFGMKPPSNDSILTSSEGGPKNVAPREISPVFPQFLDCLYQIWTQFPTKFEYDQRLLGFLFEHVYSCQFGDFLFNNEKERSQFRFNGKTIQEATVSIWDHIKNNKHDFYNALYAEEVSHDGNGLGRVDTKGSPGSVSEDGLVLFPSTDNLKYWSWMYFRSSQMEKEPEPLDHVQDLQTRSDSLKQSEFRLTESVTRQQDKRETFSNPWTTGEAIDMQPLK
ncbi:protein-tyrosine phosphatase-like protein [Gorgonomyces haynaldii]|nr:protein-tyrosine phosphatase-like protein [Gorgonomyces haynaldii]